MRRRHHSNEPRPRKPLLIASRGEEKAVSEHDGSGSESDDTLARRLVDASERLRAAPVRDDASLDHADDLRARANDA
jgi:hypothetical protein